MSEWKAKRFWKTASVVREAGGYGITLDGRAVKTPARQPLVGPSRGFADAIAAEWDAQSEKINPMTMPFTQTANAALDKVAVQHGEVADMLAAYGDSDLLCYRAQQPGALVARQAAEWDPYLDWADRMLGARLQARSGVMHVAQEPERLARLTARVHGMNAFELAAFHDLVSLSGSLILAFAATQNVSDPQVIWDVSRLDEHWQSEQWGRDEEAEAAAAVKQRAFEHAKVVFDLATPDS